MALLNNDLVGRCIVLIADTALSIIMCMVHFQVCVELQDGLYPAHTPTTEHFVVNHKSASYVNKYHSSHFAK